jgi:hypothetical protein
MYVNGKIVLLKLFQGWGRRQRRMMEGINSSICI